MVAWRSAGAAWAAAGIAWLAVGTALGQGRPGPGGGPPGPSAPSAGAGWECFGGDDLRAQRWSVEGGVPLAARPQEGVFAGFRVHASELQTRAEGYLPPSLFRIRPALAAQVRRDSFELTGASESDRPYASLDETQLGATWTRRFDLGRRHSLAAGANYQSNRSFLPDVPLPVVSWTYRRDSLLVVAGVPFASVRWTPVERLTLAARAAPGLSGSASAEWRLSPRASMALEAAAEHEAYLLRGRDDPDERLELSRRTVAGRIAFRGVAGGELALRAGWASGMRYDTGEPMGDRDRRERLEDAPVAGVSWRIGR